MATPRLADVDAVAEILGYKPKTVYELISARRIPFLRIGRSIRFDLDEIEEWLQAKRVAALDRRSSVAVPRVM